MNIRLFAGRGQYRHTNQQADAGLEQQLAAMEFIDRLYAEQNALAVSLAKTDKWATDVELVNACLDRTNRELAAENARLRTELAALKGPGARVIPLQQRGPNAA